MTHCGYTIDTEGEVTSAAAATAKTVLGIKGVAECGVDLKGFWVDFDGVTASEKPVLVEVCYVTFASNSPGTNSTAVAEKQLYGRVIPTGFTGAKNWTAEPTVVTVLKPFALDPNKGLYDYDWPLGETPDSEESEGFGIRVTVPTGGAAVDVRAGLRFERA